MSAKWPTQSAWLSLAENSNRGGKEKNNSYLPRVMLSAVVRAYTVDPAGGSFSSKPSFPHLQTEGFLPMPSSCKGKPI